MDRFKGDKIAAYYNQYRPSPPPELKDAILQYLAEKKAAPFRHAIDVGCGSGQSTRILARDFDQVTGVDVSESQITVANQDEEKPKNITYLEGTETNIPCDSSSAELVTASMAVHWFDLDRFYREVDRVLQPEGCLAIYNYNLPDIIYQRRRADKASKVFAEVFLSFLDSGYADPKQKLVFDPNGLKGLKMPYEEHKQVPNLYLDQATNVRGVIGRLLSSSTYQKYAKAHPDDTEFLSRFQKKLLASLDNPDTGENTPVVLHYPVAMVMSRKPTT
ncbi:putative methyltransferase DDB_G0268948 [Lineus longissimus]|uniref:putative methyltransferase DDB_G0268948 n=1 Tax=Lineus longissimus TaxID=88925 RepID=UPI002B4C2FA8